MKFRSVVRWPHEALGVHVTAGSVGLCLLRSGTVVFQSTVTLPPESSLTDLLMEAIRSIPANRLRRRRCRVAVDTHAALHKRIHGFAHSESEDLRRAVAETPERFFISSFREMTVSEVVVSETGDVWAAVFNSVTLEELSAALHGAGIHRATFCAASELVPRDHIVGFAGAMLAPEVASAAADDRVPAHATIDSDVLRAGGGAPARRLLRSVATVAVCAGIGALAESVVHARRDTGFISSNRGASVRTQAAMLLVDTLNAEIRRLDKFADRRTRVTALLASVARVLDTVATVEWLEWSDSVVDLSVDAERAAGIPALLLKLTAIERAEVVGGIVRRPDHDDLEHAVIRVRLRDQLERR
jgi:hypothetical protein